MYKTAWCTCKVVVLRNKPLAFFTSSLPLPSSLLKLPSKFNEQNNNCTCITLFCTFLCRPYTTTTWNDQILSWLENGNGKAINFTFSLWKRTRSPLFSSNRNSLLSSNWVTWYKREKVVKDSKSIFQRRFHWRRRCRIVRSLFWGRRASKEVSRAHLRLSVYCTTIGENSYKTKTPKTQDEKWKRLSISCFSFAHVRFC